MKRMTLLALALLTLTAWPGSAPAQDEATRYVRYEVDGRTAYGILDGETVRELDGNLFDLPSETGRTHARSDVDLLAPVDDPTKVIAVGFNYLSHIGDAEPADEPGLFWKSPTSVVGPGDDIIKPSDSRTLDFEGEMVIVIGARAQDVSEESAYDHVFGVTAGNDVSERDWQGDDLQWFRAKGSDTFGPIGPAITRGVNYDDLLLTLRLNGEVMQQERTSDLLFDVSTIVSYISRYVTLEPGDLIFTGTPGQTSAMEDGDVVEVELESVGVLRNTVRAERAGSQQP